MKRSLVPGVRLVAAFLTAFIAAASIGVARAEATDASPTPPLPSVSTRTFSDSPSKLFGLSSARETSRRL